MPLRDSKKKGYVMLNEKQKKIIGPVCIFLSALLFSLGGVCISYIPSWHALSINGARGLFSAVLIGLYMLITKHKLVWNRSVLLGAFFMCSMMTTYVFANKLTTAANAIVLQFTAPVFIILFMWIFFRQKPVKLDIITALLVLAGIVCFFLDGLGGGGILGDIIAIISGALYAGVFMMNAFSGSDPLSSILLGHAACGIIGLPFLCSETDFSKTVILSILILGLFQLGFAYILFSIGIRHTSPVAASLIAGIEPIMNPILAAWLAHQYMKPLSLVGAAIVIISIVGYNVIKQLKTEPKRQ